MALWFPLMFGITGCNKERVIDISRDLSVVIRVPADVDLTLRTPGDPGVASPLQIPRHLYFFISYNAEGNTQPRVWAISITGLSPDLWKAVPDSYGAVQAYERTIILPMPATDEVMLYVIASYNPIPDLQTLVDDVNVGTVSIDEAGINQLQLTPTQSDNSTVSIADVYAGRGKLLTGENASGGTIVCYHVAAKFDVIYNLSDDFRSGGPYEDWRVATFTLENLVGKGYYFDPAANDFVLAEALPPYTFAAGGGNNFYGRFDTYIFQPTATEFPWSVTLTNGTEQRILSGSSSVVNLSTEFAAYFRMNLTINGIGDGTGND